jgi:hypothetical protein
MATLFIAVWDNASNTLLDSPIQYDTVTVGAGSLQSSAISGSRSEIRKVRLFSDVDCFVTWGSDPTAPGDGSADLPIGAENPEIVGIKAGDKIAVIQRV